PSAGAGFARHARAGERRFAARRRAGRRPAQPRIGLNVILNGPMIRRGLFVVLMACHATVPKPVAPAAKTAVTAHLTLARGSRPEQTRGTLVVTWLTADEKQAFDSGRMSAALLRSFITRSEVIGEVDAAHEVAFTVHPARGRIALAATVDVDHVGLES